jgi:hypothetical protein
MLFFRKIWFDELNLSGKDNAPSSVIYIVHHHPKYAYFQQLPPLQTTYPKEKEYLSSEQVVLSIVFSFPCSYFDAFIYHIILMKIPGV